VTARLAAAAEVKICAAAAKRAFHQFSISASQQKHRRGEAEEILFQWRNWRRWQKLFFSPISPMF
jgi:hypothetical protein